MARVGESIDPRLLRLDPQVFRSIESAGASTGAMYASLGESAAGAIESYAERKKELDLKKEEEEKLLKEEAGAVDYLVQAGMSQEDAEYSVQALGAKAAIDTYEKRHLQGQLLQAQKDAAALAVKSAKEAATDLWFQQQLDAKLKASVDASAAAEDAQNKYELAILNNENDAVKATLKATIQSLRDKLALNQSDRDSINQNIKWLQLGREVAWTLSQPGWLEKASQEDIDEKYNLLKEVQINYIGKEGESFFALQNWTGLDPATGARVQKPAWLTETQERAAGTYVPSEIIIKPKKVGLWDKIFGGDTPTIGEDIDTVGGGEAEMSNGAAKQVAGATETSTPSLESISSFGEDIQLDRAKSGFERFAGTTFNEKKPTIEKVQEYGWKPARYETGELRTFNRAVSKYYNKIDAIREITLRGKLPPADMINSFTDAGFKDLMVAVDPYIKQKRHQNKLGLSYNQIKSYFKDTRQD